MERNICVLNNFSIISHLLLAFLNANVKKCNSTFPQYAQISAANFCEKFLKVKPKEKERVKIDRNKVRRKDRKKEKKKERMLSLRRLQKLVLKQRNIFCPFLPSRPLGWLFPICKIILKH